MDTYSPNVTCPKCASGHDWHRVEWRPHEPEREEVASDYLALRYLFTPTSEVPAEDKRTVPARPECMDIQCGRCRYRWQMRPIQPEDDRKDTTNGTP